MDRALSQELPVAPVETPDESYQQRLEQQCELAFRQGEAAAEGAQAAAGRNDEGPGRAIDASSLQNVT